MSARYADYLICPADDEPEEAAWPYLRLIPDDFGEKTCLTCRWCQHPSASQLHCLFCVQERNPWSEWTPDTKHGRHDEFMRKEMQDAAHWNVSQGYNDDGARSIVGRW